jgi:hypothetical protein
VANTVEIVISVVNTVGRMASQIHN